MEDEGVGIYFARLLKNSLSQIETIESGSITLSIIPYLRKKDTLIFIDAIRPDYSKDFLWIKLEEGTIPIKNSLHEVSIKELIGIMKLIEDGPKEVFVFGIKPYSIRPKMGLSSKMKEKIPPLKKIFIEKIKELQND